MTYKKKLIEVALPLEAINIAAAHEKQPGIGAHPRGLHLWWARRPLAAARAVIFAQMVDDPSSSSDLFPTELAQKKERGRLFKIIEDLVKWENTANEEVLQKARDAMWESWRRSCAENADHPNAKKLFDRKVLPAFHDPFAGGGALPLEAQRLGLESFATDLNPVAVLINKSMIDIPPIFSGRHPINSGDHVAPDLAGRIWEGSQGLAEDVRYYGKWMRDMAEDKIGSLFPKIEVTSAMVALQPELSKYLGRRLNVITWLWARTVKSPNPAFSNVDVPLASTFMLSSKSGKEAYVSPLIDSDSYSFVVKSGKPPNHEVVKRGTKSGGSGSSFICMMSGTPMPFDYLRTEAKAGRMGQRLMAIVAEGDRGRVYLSPTPEQEDIAKHAQPIDPPETELPERALGFRIQEYGMKKWRDLFTERQLVALLTFSDLIVHVRKKIEEDAITSGMLNDGVGLEKSGVGATAYADAVSVYLAFAIDRLADYNSTISTWKPSGEQVMQTFKRQALPMTWDFPESNILGKTAICWEKAVKYSADNLESAGKHCSSRGYAMQEDAATQTVSSCKVVSTDPPYYDNIGYADLSDFFYVWLRQALRHVFPSLFATMAVPKSTELVATPYRHGGRAKAESFFLEGMTQAMHRIAEQAHPAFPVTIYYAFKQSEADGCEGATNTGWDTFLAAVIEAGFSITGTWPMRTELSNRMIASGTNALASSIVLVCRRQYENAPTATRREFLTNLKKELPEALMNLQAGNIAPVDLAQAAIGPGMAVYTRYSKVLDADGNALSVRQALALINQTLDEALTEQEGDFDADTRWALSWFEQMGFEEDEFGVAEQLSKAKNTAVSGLVDAGIICAGKGKVRLLKPVELPVDWDPTTDMRLTVWEMVHHLVRVLEAEGESAAAKIVAKLGSKSDTARELCYRLYMLCERKKRANEAMAYNALVQSWPEIVRLSREAPGVSSAQTEDLFNQE
jgi:putative DNA methylase